MGLSGLQIYNLLPKTNCKECGFPTCLAFAMQLAAKKVSLDKCPHASEECKAALGAASAPPVRPLTVGTGDWSVKAGDETVLFRHEKTFVSPTGIAVTVSDALSAEERKERLEQIKKLTFERVGRIIKVDMAAVVDDSGDPAKFAEAVKATADGIPHALILVTTNPDAADKALAAVADRNPLLYGATADSQAAFLELAKKHGVPLVLIGDNLEELADRTQEAVKAGVEDLILDPQPSSLLDGIEKNTIIRRAAIQKTFRPLGYGTIVRVQHENPRLAAAFAGIYVCRYASFVIIDFVEPALVLPLLTVRQNIYTDPQKPLTVEEKIYPINEVDEKAPLLITTNFSLTYYTVAGEVEASRVGAYILPIDTEGTSVLTAWAADKLNAERIVEAMKKHNADELVPSKKLILPGYVAVLAAETKDDTGWDVDVGPKEAGGIVTYLRRFVQGG